MHPSKAKVVKRLHELFLSLNRTWSRVAEYIYIPSVVALCTNIHPVHRPNFAQHGKTTRNTIWEVSLVACTLLRMDLLTVVFGRSSCSILSFVDCVVHRRHLPRHLLRHWWCPAHYVSRPSTPTLCNVSTDSVHPSYYYSVSAIASCLTATFNCIADVLCCRCGGGGRRRGKV